ncbi:MAG: ABC transporter ATP-binding protein [Variibacter sp.]
MEQDFITLSSIEKSFGDMRALSDCNLSIKRGEFITLLGPSGCGKTTTLRMIAGFMRPDSGEIKIKDTLLSSSSAHVPPEKRNMGMVFQSFAVWPHMTVFDNIALPLRVRGVRKDEIKARCSEVLSLCRLDGLGSRDPHQLSGGQLQRVALARALVYRPDVLLLDEPLSNLDATLREEMRREIHAIHQAIGATFILVTHDQIEAMSLSDRVVVMNRGRIEQVGPPREIYQNPKTEFVAQFVGAANLLQGTVAAPSGADDADGLCEIDISGLRLKVRRRKAIAAGEPRTVAVHPESLQFGSETPHEDNVFDAKIKDVYFLGRIQEITLEVAGVGLRTMQFRSKQYVAGDTVKVFIPPDDIVLL